MRKERIAMKNAACYIRVSTDDQLEYSPDAQLREIRKYAASHDLFLDPNHIYMDEGISGRNTAKRTEFNHMIGTAKIKPRPFDVILLWKFSRFARNREDSVVYKSMLRKLGIEVVSISENIGDDKMSILIEAMIEAMDEYYSINLGEEVIRGMTQKALTGGIQTIPSFGYDKLPNQTFTINQQEAPYVRMVFDMYLAGSSLFAIARHLNNLGVRTKRGNKFENRQIEYMINNPVYKGYLRWTPHRAASQRVYNDPDTIIVKGTHEPIIYEELWQQVNDKYQVNKAAHKPHQRPAESKKHYLCGLVRCGNCDSALVYSNIHKGFQCHGYSRGSCSYSCFINAAKLEAMILDKLDHMAETDPYLYIKKAQKPPNLETNAIKQEISKLESFLQKAKEAYLAGIDTLAEYSQNKTKLQAQIDALQETLNTAEHKEEPAPQRRIKISEIKELIQSQADDPSKNRMLSSVFERITYRRNPKDELNLFLE